MKIALLSEKYAPDIGGLAISAGRLGFLLSSAGHEVRVFAPTSNLSASEKRTLPSGKISVMRFGVHKRADDTLVDWFELIVKEHKRAPFDVIHAYYLPQAGFVGTYAGKYLNIPSVVSIRGNDIERAAFDPSKFSHVMYTMQNAGAVTTNANELAKKAKAFFDREIHIIPNGVDTEIFKKVERLGGLAEALGLESEKKFVIGFAGELRSKKGLSALLIGYTQINKILPATLLIVGTVRAGEYQQAFDEYQRGNPDTNIIVTGQVAHKDMPAYYALMDVFVHPSLRDGMPNALLEAMACEKAVVVTPVGGATDVIEDGKNGVFVGVKDASALANAIGSLLENAELRTKLGKAARETIISRFAPEMELEDNLDVYRKLGISV